MHEMMKKTLALFSVLAFLTACEDEPTETTGPSYPTNNLVLTAEANSLFTVPYAPSSPAIIGPEVLRLIAEDDLKGGLNHMALDSDPNSPLFSAIADTLVDSLGVGSIPSLLLNGEMALLSLDILADIKAFNQRKPVASVAHKVTKNDSAWIVDSKVKFWKDTAGSGFMIETYMMVNAPAVNYSAKGIDLQPPSVNGFILSGDSLTTWVTDIPNIDSTGTVVKEGDPYIHYAVLQEKGSRDVAGVFGRPLAEYTPFGPNFNENDIIGTRTTPIQHYFLRPGNDDTPNDDIDYVFTPGFLTVIWYKDPMTMSYSYVNSYFSLSTP